MPRVQNLQRYLHDPKSGYPLKFRTPDLLSHVGHCDFSWKDFGLLASALLRMSEWDGPFPAPAPGSPEPSLAFLIEFHTNLFFLPYSPSAGISSLLWCFQARHLQKRLLSL